MLKKAAEKAGGSEDVGKDGGGNRASKVLLVREQVSRRMIPHLRQLMCLMLMNFRLFQQLMRKQQR